MFSSLSQRLGARFFDRLDLLVELSTLGEYGVDRGGIFALENETEGVTSELVAAQPLATQPVAAQPAPALPLIGRTRDDCPSDLRVSRACPAAATRP